MDAVSVTGLFNHRLVGMGKTTIALEAAYLCAGSSPD